MPASLFQCNEYLMIAVFLFPGYCGSVAVFRGYDFTKILMRRWMCGGYKRPARLHFEVNHLFPFPSRNLCNLHLTFSIVFESTTYLLIVFYSSITLFAYQFLLIISLIQTCIIYSHCRVIYILF